ncbi:molecular chaperone [Acinetobacter sp. MD2]|uniref:fimbrial biogenesis chaperone n=1 Tax=Acinetobacter sp. MD2 TaxID=2600066 RepID=UPI002D1F1677|nr:fimbria/pilus periplasmic chaperone [Acinetobacter sp. MD2]MEB3767320.1 molecular chaperone [Acinetobacter sp. MD2]
MKKLLLSCLFLSATSSYAGIALEPVQLYIQDTARQRSTTLSITSTDTDQKRIFEAHIYKWTQDEKGENVLTEDPSIIINPKSFIIQAQGKQALRIGFKQPIDSIVPKGQEGTWRLILNELPQEASPGAKVGFLLNFNMPVFVGAQDGLKLDTQFKNNTIEIKNLAQSHVQISHLQLLDVNKKVVYENKEMKYILANKTGAYPINMPLNNTQQYSIALQTDKSPEQQILKFNP